MDRGNVSQTSIRYNGPVIGDDLTLGQNVNPSSRFLFDIHYKHGRRTPNFDDKNSEAPGDLRAFFGHPLNQTTNGDAMALLHEYYSLPAIGSDLDKPETEFDKYGLRYTNGYFSDVSEENPNDIRKIGRDLEDDLMDSLSPGSRLVCYQPQSPDVDTFLTKISSASAVKSEITRQDDRSINIHGSMGSTGSPSDLINSQSPHTYVDYNNHGFKSQTDYTNASTAYPYPYNETGRSVDPFRPPEFIDANQILHSQSLGSVPGLDSFRSNKNTTEDLSRDGLKLDEYKPVNMSLPSISELRKRTSVNNSDRTLTDGYNSPFVGNNSWNNNQEIQNTLYTNISHKSDISNMHADQLRMDNNYDPASLHQDHIKNEDFWYSDLGINIDHTAAYGEGGLALGISSEKQQFPVSSINSLDVNYNHLYSNMAHNSAEYWGNSSIHTPSLPSDLNSAGVAGLSNVQSSGLSSNSAAAISVTSAMNFSPFSPTNTALYPSNAPIPESSNNTMFSQDIRSDNGSNQTPWLSLLNNENVNVTTGDTRLGSSASPSMYLNGNYSTAGTIINATNVFTVPHAASPGLAASGVGRLLLTERGLPLSPHCGLVIDEPGPAKKRRTTKTPNTDKGPTKRKNKRSKNLVEEENQSNDLMNGNYPLTNTPGNVILPYQGQHIPGTTIVTNFPNGPHSLIMTSSGGAHNISSNSIVSNPQNSTPVPLLSTSFSDPSKNSSVSSNVGSSIANSQSESAARNAAILDAWRKKRAEEIAAQSQAATAPLSMEGTVAKPLVSLSTSFLPSSNVDNKFLNQIPPATGFPLLSNQQDLHRIARTVPTPNSISSTIPVTSLNTAAMVNQPFYPTSAASDANTTSTSAVNSSKPVMPPLPFPLPAVPPGYRLVITHRPLPTNDQQVQQPVTQLIIDHPSYVPTSSSVTTAGLPAAAGLGAASNGTSMSLSSMNFNPSIPPLIQSTSINTSCRFSTGNPISGSPIASSCFSQFGINSGSVTNLSSSAASNLNTIFPSVNHTSLSNLVTNTQQPAFGMGTDLTKILTNSALHANVVNTSTTPNLTLPFNGLSRENVNLMPVPMQSGINLQSSMNLAITTSMISTNPLATNLTRGSVPPLIPIFDTSLSSICDERLKTNTTSQAILNQNSHLFPNFTTSATSFSTTHTANNYMPSTSLVPMNATMMSNPNTANAGAFGSGPLPHTNGSDPKSQLSNTFKTDPLKEFTNFDNINKVSSSSAVDNHKDNHADSASSSIKNAWPWTTKNFTPCDISGKERTSESAENGSVTSSDIQSAVKENTEKISQSSSVITTSSDSVACSALTCEIKSGEVSVEGMTTRSPEMLDQYSPNSKHNKDNSTAVRPNTLELATVMKPQVDALNSLEIKIKSEISPQTAEMDIKSCEFENDQFKSNSNQIITPGHLSHTPGEHNLEKSTKQENLLNNDLFQESRNIQQNFNNFPTYHGAKINRLNNSVPFPVKHSPTTLLSPAMIKQSPCHTPNTMSPLVDVKTRHPVDVSALHMKFSQEFGSAGKMSQDSGNLSSTSSSASESYQWYKDQDLTPSGVRGLKTFSSPDDSSQTSGTEAISTPSSGSIPRFGHRRSSSGGIKKCGGTRTRACVPKTSHVTFVPKIEPDLSGFHFYLDAPISTCPRTDEDRLTYLNKGQYYSLVLNYSPSESSTLRPSGPVKSVVMVMFRGRQSPTEELKTWEFWHSRQHSYKQRVLDMDSKITQGNMPLNIEEIAFNGVAVWWNPHESPVTLNVAINCLSTDFSHQKGVKGNPLHIQIDTFQDESSAEPTHRAYCQIKVFCDKGADRKAREEERKRTKGSEAGSETPDDVQRQDPCDRTQFYTMLDRSTLPVLYTPADRLLSKIPLHTDTSIFTSQLHGRKLSPAECSRLVMMRRFGDQRHGQKSILYVREKEDTVFTALVLEEPTLSSLSKAIREKYNIPPESSINVLNQTAVCLIKVDDNFVSHFANESTFIIDITTNSPASEAVSSSSEVSSHPMYNVTLTDAQLHVNPSNITQTPPALMTNTSTTFPCE